MNQPDPAFEALLEHLKTSRGFDFTGYKRSSLMRRVNRRMDQVGIASYAEYLDYLEVHPDEFTALFNTILINVTGFFRDPEAWDHLRDGGPARAARGEAAQPADPGVERRLRLRRGGLHPGDGAGRALGPEEFRERVKIYATDVDEEALTQARQAAYTERDVAGVPPELLERYFELAGGRYVFRKDLRRSVIFGRNDLVQDAPISRIDLLVCRNTLMYFNAETQARILCRFHFALPTAACCSSARRRCCSATAACSARRPQAADLPQGVARPSRRTALLLGELPPPGARPRADRARRSAQRGAARAARSRRSWSPRTGSWRWPTGRPSPVRGLGHATSAGRSATSSSPTARSSCAATSSRPSRSAARCG